MTYSPEENTPPVEAAPEAVAVDATVDPTPDVAIDPPATLDELDLSEVEGVPETASAEATYQSPSTDLLREIEGIKGQLEERTGQYMRLTADFENFRKRTAKDREELELRIRCDTIRELLSVIDNFERARSFIKPQTDGELNLHKSYQGIYRQLVDSLKRLGVVKMRPEGQEFDPNLHEAVMREPSNEHPEGTVLEQLQDGYLLGDRVLRHAMVKVAAPGEPVTTAEESYQSDTEA
ncbi:MAG: nucleotide exchange factor GrpE [Oscillatoriales cyanobacterium]|nr:MAG: nucleotide exchange factor GrpE [Oscillatoriales cyanobacterium]